MGKAARLVLHRVVPVLAVVLSASAAFALPIRPSLRHEAGDTKTNSYVTDGFFAGGDKQIAAARLLDIRRAPWGKGGERVVLDVESVGEASSSLPYFQVQSAPQEGRFIISIWANVDYALDKDRVVKSFSKSTHFKHLNLMPSVEDGLSIIELTLSRRDPEKGPKFEVFKLPRTPSQPTRIIIDVL